MQVRFKKGVSDTEFRISYDLVSDIPTIEFDEVLGRYCMCYNLKIFGFVSCELLEVAYDPQLPAIDVLIEIFKGHE